MSDIVRTGRTIREVTYLSTKNVQPGVDFEHTAPAGARVEWRGKTNEDYLASYNGQLLHWVDLPDYINMALGLIVGTDFVWDD